MSDDFVDDIVAALRNKRGNAFLLISLSDINTESLRDIESHPNIQVWIDDDEQCACVSYLFDDEASSVEANEIPDVGVQNASGPNLGEFRGDDHAFSIDSFRAQAHNASRESVVISSTIPAESDFGDTLFRLSASMRAETLPCEDPLFMSVRITFEALRFDSQTKRTLSRKRDRILESVRFGIRPANPNIYSSCIEVKPVPAAHSVKFLKRGIGGGLSVGATKIGATKESPWELVETRTDSKIEAVCASGNIARDAEWLWELNTWEDGSSFKALDRGLSAAELKGWMFGRRPARSSFLAERRALSAEWMLGIDEEDSSGSASCCFELYAIPCFTQVSVNNEVQRKLKIRASHVMESRIYPATPSCKFYFSLIAPGRSSIIAACRSERDAAEEKEPKRSVRDREDNDQKDDDREDDDPWAELNGDHVAQET